MSDTQAGTAPEEPLSAALAFVATAVAVLAAEAALAAALAGRLPLPGGIPAIAAAHAGVCLIPVGLIVLRRRRGLDVRLAGLLAVTTPFLGPLGPAFTLFSALCHALFRRHARGFHEWYLSLFPESESAPAQELYELIVTGRARSDTATSTSFVEVLSVGSPPQKQAVIALVARHFRPAFTPALKMALLDDDPSVRVQAATAMARVENEFSERWMALETAVARKPDDARLRTELARLLDAYAFCGLHDETREGELRAKALEHYRRAHADQPDDPDLRLDLGRLMLRLDHVEEAATLLKPLVTDTAERRVLVWYAECLYRLSRFDELRALVSLHAEALVDRRGAVDPMAGVVELWTEREVAA